MARPGSPRPNHARLLDSGRRRHVPLPYRSTTATGGHIDTLVVSPLSKPGYVSQTSIPSTACCAPSKMPGACRACSAPMLRLLRNGDVNTDAVRDADRHPDADPNQHAVRDSDRYHHAQSYGKPHGNAKPLAYPRPSRADALAGGWGPREPVTVSVLRSRQQYRKRSAG